MVREILKWCDSKFEEALLEENESKGMAKAAQSGAVEGFVDGIAIVGLTGFVIGIAEIVKSVVKK